LHYYLTTWRGSGTDVDPFVPDLLPAGSTVTWHAIDLRANPATATGYAVVACVSRPPTDPATAIYLGDSTFPALSANVKTQIRKNLGLSTLTASTVPDVLAELLTVHATTDGTNWKPLRAEQDGKRRIVLGGLLWQEA
jgi:hypothetical protein